MASELHPFQGGLSGNLWAILLKPSDPAATPDKLLRPLESLPAENGFGQRLAPLLLRALNQPSNGFIAVAQFASQLLQFRRLFNRVVVRVGFMDCGRYWHCFVLQWC